MLTDNIYLFLVLGFLFAVPFLLLCRWASGSWFSPLVVQGAYVGFGGCFIGLIGFDKTNFALVCSAGFVAYLSGLLLAWRSQSPCLLVDARRPQQVAAPEAFTTLACAVMVLLVLVTFLLIFAILRTGISLDTIANFRYIVRSEAKWPFLIFMAVKAAAIFPLVVIRRGPLLILALLVYLFTLAPVFLLGSKGAAIGFVFDALIIYYLRGAFVPLTACAPKENFIFRLMFLGVLGFFVSGSVSARPEKRFISSVLIFIVIAASVIVFAGPLGMVRMGMAVDYGQASSIAFNRVLSSFDSVFFAVDSGILPFAAGFSLFEWWFASPLKVLGLYGNYYNASNEYIMAHYYAQDNLAGMFPNNFQVVEVVLSMPWLMAIPFLGFSGYLFGRTLMWLAKRRLQNPAWALAFVIFVVNPYIMLLDGQSFWTSLFIVIACIGVALVISKIMDRGTGTSPLAKNVQRPGSRVT